MLAAAQTVSSVGEAWQFVSAVLGVAHTVERAACVGASLVLRFPAACCPKGHPLEPHMTRVGTCDGCSRRCKDEARQRSSVIKDKLLPATNPHILESYLLCPRW